MLNVRSQKTTNKKCDFIIYSCQMQNAFWHLSNLTKTQSLFFKVTKMYSPFWILSSIGHSTSLKHKYTMFQKPIHTMYVPFNIFFCCHFWKHFFFETAPYYTKIVELCLFSRVYKSQLFLLFMPKSAQISAFGGDASARTYTARCCSLLRTLGWNQQDSVALLTETEPIWRVLTFKYRISANI